MLAAISLFLNQQQSPGNNMFKQAEDLQIVQIFQNGLHIRKAS